MSLLDIGEHVDDQLREHDHEAEADEQQAQMAVLLRHRHNIVIQVAIDDVLGEGGDDETNQHQHIGEHGQVGEVGEEDVVVCHFA